MVRLSIKPSSDSANFARFPFKIKYFFFLLMFTPAACEKLDSENTPNRLEYSQFMFVEESWNGNIIISHKGVRYFELNYHRMFKYYENPKIVFYDSLEIQYGSIVGKNFFSLQGDHGRHYELQDSFLVYGNVKFKSYNGNSISADSLFWGKPADRIKLSSNLKLISEDSVYAIEASLVHPFEKFSIKELYSK